MERTAITNHSELLTRIAELKEDKEIQEVKLKQTFKELSSTLSILSLFKKKEYSNQPIDLAKQGISVAIDLLFDIIWGKNRSLKGNMSSILIKKAINILIDNKFDYIVSTVTDFFSNRSNPKTNQNQ